VGSIGAAEILVVLVVALLVLGPSRLPDAARSLGKALGEFRRVSSGLQAEVRDAFSEPAPSYPSDPDQPPSRLPAGPGEPVTRAAGDQPDAGSGAEPDTPALS
jgi:sec-independent protein translocase protein TatB